MQAEIEAKFLNVNHQSIQSRLKELGATQKFPQRLMRRKNFDFPDGRLARIGGWVRLRDEGDKITLSYKQLNSRTVDGMQEVCVTVDDFEQTCKLLVAMGMVQKSYQETKRESWQLQGVEVELDEWPWISPYVEIEGPSEELLREAAGSLGLDWAKAVHGSVEIAYQGEYDVAEEEVNSWEEITFTPVPDWLKKVRTKHAAS